MSNTAMLRPLAAVALAATLAACAQTEAPRPGARIYAADLQGKAKTCTAPEQVSLAADRPTEASITVDNDGGWCGIHVAQSGPKPYDAGLMASRPAHGRVLVRTVGDRTRVDYFPDPAFGGTDSFAVRFLPGGATMQVAVNVTYTPPPAPPAPPAAPPRAPSRTPARRAR